MEIFIKRNVIIVIFDQLFMSCIFSEYRNLRYLHLMINDVMKLKIKKTLELETGIFDCMFYSFTVVKNCPWTFHLRPLK